VSMRFGQPARAGGMRFYHGVIFSRPPSLREVLIFRLTLTVREALVGETDLPLSVRSQAHSYLPARVIGKFAEINALSLSLSLLFFLQIMRRKREEGGEIDRVRTRSILSSLSKARREFVLSLRFGDHLFNAGE